MSTSVKRLGVLLPALAERPMTVLEIAQMLGVSHISSVHAWVKKAHDAGLIYIDHYGPPVGRTKQRAHVYGCDFKRWPDTPRPTPGYARRLKGVDQNLSTATVD